MMPLGLVLWVPELDITALCFFYSFPSDVIEPFSSFGGWMCGCEAQEMNIRFPLTVLKVNHKPI